MTWSVLISLASVLLLWLAVHWPSRRTIVFLTAGCWGMIIGNTLALQDFGVINARSAWTLYDATVWVATVVGTLIFIALLIILASQSQREK